MTRSQTLPWLTTRFDKGMVQSLILAKEVEVNGHGYYLISCGLTKPPLVPVIGYTTLRPG